MGSRKSVSIEGLKIGGGAPVRVESMLKTRLTDIAGGAEETAKLAAAGCELARVALPEQSLAAPFAELIKKSPLPLMADIHFDHRLALAALGAGCRAIRINPGNMSGSAGLAEVTAAAKDLGAVIRIGANGGSLNNAQLEKTDGDRGAALVLAVEEQLKMLLENKFEDIIISGKILLGGGDGARERYPCQPLAIPAPHRHHRGGVRQFRDRQGRGRHRPDARAGNRQHHPRQPHLAWRGRGRDGLQHASGASDCAAGAGSSSAVPPAAAAASKSPRL